MRPESTCWKHSKTNCGHIVLAALALLAGVPPAGAKPVYTILPATTAIFGINDSGATTGTYSNGGAFLRTPDGTITSFQVSGDAQSTSALSINNDDSIVGYYMDRNDTAHGFVRTADGTITIFDAPNAGTAAYQGTFAYSVNASGTIAGESVDSAGVEHGLVRTPDGAFFSFDVGHAIGTLARSINDKGAIAGQYADLHSPARGFVRTSNGKITKFDAPGINFSTYVSAINSKGVIAGEYLDENQAAHGYVRAADGSIAEFDGPGPHTEPYAINTKGTSVGVYFSADFKHVFGFMRNSTGMIDTLRMPHSTGSLEPEAINTSGVIAGILTVRIDKHTTTRYGFIRTP